jgi:hypothetical protein
MIAFNEKSYGELVIHPPPISFALLPLLPFIFSRQLMAKATACFSLIVYWVENIFIIMAFLGFELAVMPFAYLKTWINLFRNSPHIGIFFLNMLLFGICGPFIMMWYILKDCKYFITLLSYTNGCKAEKDDELEEKELPLLKRM